MKIIAGDFGENKNGTLHRAAGWFGGPLDSIGIGWFGNIKASEIREVQAVADNSKSTVLPGNISGTTVGGIAGFAIAGPIGLAIGALLGSSSNKRDSVLTEKAVAVLVLLTDGRQFLASCDLKEFGLLSAASSKNRAEEAKKVAEEAKQVAKEAKRSADGKATELLLAEAPTLPKRVLAILQRFASSKDFYSGFYVVPNIPPKKLATATEKAGVPAEEEILALIDCTIFGSASDCLLFGSCGFYYHHSQGSKPNPGTVIYSEFPKTTFETSFWGTCINVGKDRYCRTHVGGPAKVVEILNAIRDTVIQDRRKALTKAKPTEPVLDEELTAVSLQKSPDLQRIINAWPTLPAAIRAGILAMVQAASKGG